jgi:UDP-glucose-4-epimerase GalE
MRIFITGGAGYVGSACLRYIAQRGHDVLAYDNLVEGHRAAVGSHQLAVGDIADTEKLTDYLREFRAEAVMHFAAATYVGESVQNPEYHYRNNIGGSLSLLNAMRAAGVKRMLFSSTCATYGMSQQIPMNEDTAQEPFSPYARTKLAVEWMIRDFAHAYGLGFTLLRYFNAAGAAPDGRFGEYHNPETHLIPIVLSVPLGQRDSVLVYGDDYPTPDGTCIRDYIHVDDLAAAHLLAIGKTTPATREVFNVGTGRGHSVLEIIRACEHVTGTQIRREHVARRPGDPPALVADPGKLMRELGWRPKYGSITDVIATAWAWHRQHPDGYGRP